MLGKRDKCHGARVRSNFLVAWRKGPSFIMAHREKAPDSMPFENFCIAFFKKKSFYIQYH
jgi:hypothetical protein